MKSTAFKMLCRLLIVSLFALPFQSAMAGMIGTQQALAAASAQADRDAIVSALTRSDVASQLQAQGVDTNAAKARVAAMTDQEASALAGQIQSVPAGAHTNGWTIAAVVIIAIVVWYFYAYK
ncbi:MAG TPA: PA2779 family protein [Caldimonas sp.]